MSADAEELLVRLDTQRVAFADTYNRLHDLLAQHLPAGPKPVNGVSPLDQALPTEPQTPRSPRPSIATHGTVDRSGRPRKSSGGGFTLETASDSRATGHNTSDDDEDEEAFYVQTPLEAQSYDHAGLRKHLQSYKWTVYGEKVLQDVLDDPKRLSQPTLFPTIGGAVRDRSHLSHCQVFDVGADGAPIECREEDAPSNAIRIWNTIKDLNKPGKESKAVGRITIVQEPSPLLFGAVHHTSNSIFDVDELFQHLVSISRSSANMHRLYDQDPRKRKSFVFNFEYFTLVGVDCQPMDWQMADRQRDVKKNHIAITRCSSVVALSLGGEPIKKIKNRSRRKTVEYGYVYDPFAPWQLLNVQCYPDWVSAGDAHEPSRNYVNGVEAFMTTLLGEFRDAGQRFDKIYEAITHLITPPLDFIFNSDVRDKLLFEDADYTYSRRYFWGYQTLGIVNDALKAIVDAYEDTFTDDVWEGKHRSLWPLLDQTSPRNVYFKKRMAALRQKFAVEITKLRRHMTENEERRREIRGLREELFVGTSIQESRKSVENTEITVQQGHNIKLLTLVNIFFLPLTFVTSVFGMTNMPEEHHYWMFAIVIATVCVPFFILIGSLNTTRGMHFWRRQFVSLYRYIKLCIVWLSRRGRMDKEQMEGTEPDIRQIRRLTAKQQDAGPLRRWLSARSGEGVDIDGMAAQASMPDARPGFWRRRKSSRLAEMWTKESVGQVRSEGL